LVIDAANGGGKEGILKNEGPNGMIVDFLFKRWNFRQAHAGIFVGMGWFVFGKASFERFDVLRRLI